MILINFEKLLDISEKYDLFNFNRQKVYKI